MINKVILIGNLTRDAETVSGAQTTMTRLRLATDSNWRNAAGDWQRNTEYHSLVTFGDLAERCAVTCTKGRRVYVEGRLRTREYVGSEGLRRWSTEIVAARVKTLDGAHGEDAADPADGESDADGAADAYPAPAMVSAGRTERRRPRRDAAGDDGGDAVVAGPDSDGLTPGLDGSPNGMPQLVETAR